MKLILKKNMIKAICVRILNQKGWLLSVQASVLFVIFVFALSRIDALCVDISFLMWFRKDACKVWQGTNPVESNSLNWWQRACVMERDWNRMDYVCKDVRLMGNWPVCFDAPYTPVKNGKPCIVYSFGIAYDFRFDEAMAYYNCSVYSFDPSMSLSDYQRSRNVFFKKMGLGAEDNQQFVPRADGYAKATDRWKIMTLDSVMKSLGHSPHDVSVLKMDIEGTEWAVLQNVLEKGILRHFPQVLIEWHLFTDHPPRSQYERIHHDYKQFQKLGFQKFWMRNEGHNHWLPKMETQAETAWINSNYRLKI